MSKVEQAKLYENNTTLVVVDISKKKVLHNFFQ